MTTVRSRRPGWSVFLLSWAALATLAIAWAVATPLGGSPDEPSHLIKAAAVVRGEFLGTPTSEPAELRVQVPVGIAQANAWPCFIVNITSPASCLTNVENGSNLVSATTKAGLYNPVYYMLVGWPSLMTSNTTAMVLGMRTVSALICTAFLALAFMVLMRMTGRATLAVAFLGATTPMLFFLAGAVNPNAFEVVTAIALLTLLLSIVRHRGEPPSTAALVGVAVSGFLLANTRSISPLWMALIAVIVIVYAEPRRLLELIKLGSVRLVLVILAASVVLSVVWTLFTGTLTSLGTFPGAGHLSAIQGFFLTMTRIIDPGIIGYFGWLDIPAPPYVWAVWSAVAIGVVVCALAVARARGVLTVVVAVCGVILLPAIIQGVSIRGSGYIWQGRYTLAAFASLVIVAGVVLSDRVKPTTATKRIFAIVAGLVILGQVMAFASTLQHFAVGNNPSLAAPYLHPNWSPLGGTALWVGVSALGIAGFVVVAWFVIRRYDAVAMITPRPEAVSSEFRV